MGTGMMGFGLLMMFFGFLVVVGIIAVTMWAILQFAGDSGRGRRSAGGEARQILDERYARGEIDQHEYQRIRRELG